MRPIEQFLSCRDLSLFAGSIIHQVRQPSDCGLGMLLGNGSPIGSRLVWDARFPASGLAPSRHVRRLLFQFLPAGDGTMDGYRLEARGSQSLAS
jgi:hypothetical protein